MSTPPPPAPRPAAHRVIADLRWIASHWDDLIESRTYGAPAAYRKTHLTPEQRDDRAWQAVQERWERTADAIGASPAPLRVSVLDIATGLAREIDRVACELADATNCPHPAPSLAPGGILEFAARRLAELTPDDADLTAWASSHARAWVSAIADALGLLYDGQRLDVECPWCGGVTPETPAGGAHTWRVRDLLGRRPCTHGEIDRRFCNVCPQLVVIVCEGICEPPQRDVGTWWHAQPCWPVSEWDWLAARVRATAETA